MYGLGAAYSIPESMPIYNSIGAAGRWYLSWTNPDGTHTGGWQNTMIGMDPHWVNPPESVWESLGVKPDYMVTPEKVQGDIRPADFAAANPINPASIGPAATAPPITAPGSPHILGLQSEGSPAFTFPGTSFEVPSLSWLGWAAIAGGLWFAFGRGK